MAASSAGEALRWQQHVHHRLHLQQARDFFGTFWSPPLTPGAAAAAAAAVFVGLYLTWHVRKYSERKYLRVVWPVVGGMPFILHHVAHGSLFDVATQLAEEQEDMTFVNVVPGWTDIITANPTIVQHILKDNFANYPKGETFQACFQDLLGNGIFNSDGEMWRRQRKTASHEFSTRSLRDLVASSLSLEISQRLLPTLDQVCAVGEAVDMQDVLQRFMLDNICRVAFGADPGCLAPGLPPQLFAIAFDAATKVTFMRTMLPKWVWKAMRAFGLGPEATLRQSLQVVREFTGEVVARRRRMLQQHAQEKQQRQQQQQQQQQERLVAAPAEASEGSSDGAPSNVTGVQEQQHTDLLTRMMLLALEEEKAVVLPSSLPQPAGQHTTDASAFPPTPSSPSLSTSCAASSDDFLRDACTNFILAGRDTSAVALTWFLWVLTQHPRVEAKVVAEVQAVARERASNAGDDKQGGDVEENETPFSYDDLRRMTYTHATISESMRLYPPVPGDFKEAAADDTLPNGMRVRAGWRVSYSIYAMGRQTRLWGADALEFRPERWLDESSGEVRAESQFKYTVFNAGPRLCLGRDVAYLQMKAVASSILRRYRLRLVAGHRVEQKMSVTLFMKHGLLMTLERR